MESVAQSFVSGSGAAISVGAAFVVFLGILGFITAPYCVRRLIPPTREQIALAMAEAGIAPPPELYPPEREPPGSDASVHAI
ncbi:hypothetical protein FQN54_008579 [Arachnomyces sp. PD_36]|nr:hypothetical protein FQN54_008579 [Arachnomyces sp. PD_36]